MHNVYCRASPVLCPPACPPRPWTPCWWSPACPAGYWTPSWAALRSALRVCGQGYCTFQKPLLKIGEIFIISLKRRFKIHHIQILWHSLEASEELPSDCQKSEIFRYMSFCTKLKSLYHRTGEIFQIFVINLRPILRFCVPQTASVVNRVMSAHRIEVYDLNSRRIFACHLIFWSSSHKTRSLNWFSFWGSTLLGLGWPSAVNLLLKDILCKMWTLGYYLAWDDGYHRKLKGYWSILKLHNNILDK